MARGKVLCTTVRLRHHHLTVLAGRPVFFLRAQPRCER